MVAVAIASFREVRGANVVTVFPKQTGIVTIPRYTNSCLLKPMCPLS
ncbi:hypothetical protein GDI0116 [Gluconacetobacter diazotrophicus PA1 5]|uniref:Uncharacterized protein n=1 Tax=Gluconacetobacter diazotrophicus (strain ATCC 49037 / DSM 5601 / CCUG 37298 / CIP 103539 / LMG 7603 / PAl5) TaxID=272568 RepID=A9H1T6_GLUDA|nr:hypothetical protein GDI0116 [Gluconacetobacter diazotrophicus PA1 5]